MRTTAKVLDAGKVTIPVEVREGLGIEQGTLVELNVRPVKSTNPVPRSRDGSDEI